jgi:two-component sensor histidine kinase
VDGDAGSGRRDSAALELSLSGRPAAVPAARGAVAGLGPYMDEPCAKKAALLVSELVSNAILHGGAGGAGSLKLGMAIMPSMVRVEVCDPGEGFESPRASDPDREGGWGLVLMQRLADRWGTKEASTEAEERHTCVWFELDRPGDEAAGTSAP